MKLGTVIFALALLLIGASSFTNEDKAGVTHSKWDAILKKHVSSKGNVNYQGIKTSVGELDAYLKELSDHVPSSSASKNEKLAYWMNAYNAFTVKLIVNNYPVKSIKDISPKPWNIKFIKLGGKTYDLNTIEHEILRKMGDARIHVGINCASFSCPKMLNKAFTVSNVNSELDKLCVVFVNDTSRNKLGVNAVELSKIFSWFKSDFAKGGSVIKWINKYSKIKVSESASVSYMKYNWSLNK